VYDDIISRGFANKTFNHFRDAVNRFTNHTIKTYYPDYKSPFAIVKKKKLFSKNYSISEQEFLQVLDNISPDDCYIESKVKSRKNPKRKNIYREWLKDAYLLGLFTGGRREEIVSLKFSGIKLHDNGSFSHIEINHFKINRQNSDVVSDTEFEIKEFLITDELGKLLHLLGYEKYKDTDKYILAPEETLKRSTMMDMISRSFSIFYSKLNNGKKRQFKHLRKTYISSAVAQFGTSATALSSHTKFDMIKQSYLDREVLKKAQKSFSVFGNSNDSVPQNSTTPS
jgi:integrase